MKKCTKCLIEQEESEFSIRVDGRCSTWCKECVRINSRKWYALNKERSDANRKKYYQENIERKLEKSRERYLKYYGVIRRRANARNRTPEEREKKNEYAKNWCKQNKDKLNKRLAKWKRDNKEKAYAHQAILWAVRLGMIKKPEKCEICERIVKLQGHHDDYKKPLVVRWVCKICHNHLHNKLLDVNPKE